MPRTRCPRCRHAFSATSRIANCKNCDQVFVVPELSADATRLRNTRNTGFVFLLLVMLSCAAVIGTWRSCSRTTDNTQVAKETDPVELFKLQVLNPIADRQKKPKAFIKHNWGQYQSGTPMNYWAKSVEAIGDIRFDVKKTDSLISPVIAEVEIQIKLLEQDAHSNTSRELCVKAPWRLGSGRTVRARYSFRDGSWEPAESNSSYWPLADKHQNDDDIGKVQSYVTGVFQKLEELDQLQAD